MSFRFALTALFALGVFSSNVLSSVFLFAQDSPEPNEPKIAGASNEGEQSMGGYKIPEGVEGQLFAAEPMIANPVAFYVDDRGRVFVCETFRQSTGVVDNRSYGREWVDADLEAKTVEDRRQYHLRLLSEDDAKKFVEEDDRIRVLVDADGDGKADESKVFAKRFNNLVDGTGAGVLEYRGNVYFTCIPAVYLMRDEDNDLVADGRTVLHTGYGVRVAFRGHDLHGLTIGPDGRLYFSIGDRGANIPQKSGNVVNVESGSVFRCELDGSNLEIFATGLRNPQELAFDEYGNLFTGDNNSDSGDQARWVYVVEGGDTGWRMAYQYLPDRGPFNRERIWEPMHEGQPFYIMPPIANFADGPSGLEYYPGTGFGDMFQEQFLLADFRGTPSRSGIRSIKNEADGAFFKIAEDAQPFWNVLATDLQFGPDGALYISDWVNGWNGEGKGRIYRYTKSERSDDLVREVAAFLRADIAEIDSELLANNLKHVDRRVRHKSQLELAERGDQKLLIAAALNGDSVKEQLHGVWGLDHLARRKPATLSESVETWLKLCESSELELRAHSLRLLGEFAGKVDSDAAEAAVLKGLADEEPRVRYFALVSAGKMRLKAAVDSIVASIVDNAGQDPVLRHAAVMALSQTVDANELAGMKTNESLYVRLSAVVALRRQQSELVSDFLDDESELVVAEAARAIHDSPIDTAMKKLAWRITKSMTNESIIRRVLDANFRTGNATAIASYVLDAKNPEKMRVEGLAMLGVWAQPSGRDRVTGMWRPIEERSDEPAKKEVATLLKRFGKSGSSDVAVLLELGKVASRYGLGESAAILRSLVTNESLDVADRAAALQAMGKVGATQADINLGLKSEEAKIRAAALSMLRSAMPDQAKDLLAAAALNGSIPERQIAISELGEIKDAEMQLASVLELWLAGKLPAETQLEALEAVEKRQASANIKSLLEQINATRDRTPLGKYRESLVGGDVERGRRVFVEKVSLSCVRCHKVAGSGGEVGPDLSKIGIDKKRDYILEAIVDPNKVIAKGFESAVLLDVDDQVHTGVVRAEDEDTITLVDAQGKATQYLKDDIIGRKVGRSGMPADIITKMSKRELRDLVEYLASLDGTQKVADESH